MVKGQPGHPVLFDAGVRADLGDPAQPHPPSLRQWRAAHPKSVHLWSVDNPHYTHDLDTPEDLDALASARTTAH
jgi:CTP:molybdopterin cytidylyltransferase MocA